MTATSRPERTRGRACVLLAASEPSAALVDCLRSVAQTTDSGVAVVIASPEPHQGLEEVLERIDGAERLWITGAGEQGATGTLTAVVDAALEDLWPCDVVLLSEPCRVTAGWLDHLGEAAYVDTNIASASALSDRGAMLALSDTAIPEQPLDELASDLARRTLRLRPRLNLAAPPCTYLRRDALELVGGLDRGLELEQAIADFAQRCLLSGLGHVLADDVLVGRLGAAGAHEATPALLRERSIAASGVLPRAMRAVRRDSDALAVTLDARALGANITGTQRQILELTRSLAATSTVQLRLLVAPDADRQVVEELRSLPGTDVLRTDEITSSTEPSAVFHRPQQVFEPDDLRFAVRLGSRLVINQLDLIAYRNPGYHANAAAWHSHRRVGRQALAAADRIVVLSRHTRDDLLADELADAERIRVVAPGLDHPRQQLSERPAGLAVAPAAEPTGAGGYILCLGTDFKHKNRLFALRLLRELRSAHGWEGRLVFAGTHIPHGSSVELERNYLDRHQELREAVVDLGSVSEPEKVWLMEHAGAVVYPSTYEGFGLVPLEAAMSGVPCVFAAQTSLAEVLPAEAAAIVPWDAHDSAARTVALLSDPPARDRHVQTLLEVARGFTWRAAADATIGIYEEVAIAPQREAQVLTRDEVERELELRELVSAHDALVRRLVREREHAQGMYDELHAEVGIGLGLIGPNGALPEDLQRGLLSLSARPRLSRPIYRAGAGLVRAARGLARHPGAGPSEPQRRDDPDRAG